MDITWHGLGSFSIKGKPISGEVSIITDPFVGGDGLRFPRTLSAAVVAQSQDSKDANNVEAISGLDKKAPFLVSHAGEYEVEGIFVTGIRALKESGEEHTIYRIQFEDITIAFLGSLDRKLNNTELDGLGNIDILILPVGGGDVMDTSMAQEVVNQVEPRLVLPSYASVAGSKRKLADADTFCKELACAREDLNKLKITKSSLPVDEIKVVVLAKS
jgi:L-ascorbate metabolism protein UlaG (beta-lactamase superfamily)